MLWEFTHGAMPRVGMSFCLFFAGATMPTEARLAEAILAFDGSDAYPLPERLSETGLYSGIGTRARQVTAGIHPFDVNSPLWSDGTSKQRFITVPEGKTIIPMDTSRYAFPDKSVMVKNFLMDTVVGDTNSRILIETRFQVFHVDSSGAGSWHGISYAWRRDQSDALLVSHLDGANQVINQRVGGKQVGKRWRYPSRGDCLQCHAGGRQALGFITPQLHRPSRSNPSVNQLQDLMTRKVLASNPLTAKPNALKWAALDDASASLELRSRSYFASNCSHCHGNGRSQGGGVTHDFDYLNTAMRFMADSADPYAPGPYVNKPVGSSKFPFLIYPGYPDSSAIVSHMLIRGTFEEPNPDQMPILATYQPDSAALKVLSDWICTMGGKKPGACALPRIDVPGWAPPVSIHNPERPVRALAPGDYTLRREGDVWRLLAPRGASAPPSHLRLASPEGKAVPLSSDGRGGYFAVDPLRPGIYLLRVGGRAGKIVISP